MAQQIPLTFSFPLDDEAIETYFQIRQACYRRLKNGDPQFDGRRSRHDHNGHILIAHAGTRVVGGARLVGSEPGNRQLLPYETPDFQVRRLFPELGLDEKSYGDISRVALLPEFHGGGFLREVIRRMVWRGAALHYAYFFVVASERQTPVNLRMIRGLGFGCEIYGDLEVPHKPEYGRLNMKLTRIDVPSIDVQKEQHHD